jgi:hypothetical protein
MSLISTIYVQVTVTDREVSEHMANISHRILDDRSVHRREVCLYASLAKMPIHHRAEHNQHNNYESKHFTDEGRPVMSSAACGCYTGLIATVALPSERNL